MRQIEWIGHGQWIKTDTHVHTRFSDGGRSVDEVVNRAVGFGCECVAITDHADANLKAGTAAYVEAINISRRQFPGTIVMAGLEWNLPPWGGNEHATVLFPPCSDELSVLSEFKTRFDDLDREQHSTELADSALQWLATNGACNGVQPLVIYNHPNRKSASKEEFAPRLEHWRQVSDLVVAFEGAPGHQRADPLGAYKGPVALIDRWDPAAAEIGGAWDRLLQQGLDVWGAHAPSDFHSESGGDYWPGEFSETWLYAPEKSAAGVLQALRAGTFFGAHGHIAREVSLRVLAPGLVRAAVSGEVIETRPASFIQAEISCLVPERDWKGDANHLDEIELIVVDADGARIAAKSRPSELGAALTADLHIPDGGMVLRARGRRIVADGPDLLFYTNPIRVVTPGTTTWSSRPADPTGDEEWQRPAGDPKSPGELIRIAIGLGMLLLTSWVAYHSLRRRKAQPADVVLVDQKHAISPLGGEHYLAMAGLVILFAAYGSFVPLNFRPAPLGDGWAVFLKIVGGGVHFRSRSDVIVNVLLFVPIGSLGLAGMTVGRPHGPLKWFAAPIVLSACLLTSCAIELAQFWFPPRIPALNDIAAQFIGATIGIGGWLVFGKALHGWLSALVGAQQQQERIDRLLQFYAGGLFLYGLLPLDIVTSPAELWHKFRDGKVRMRPFAEWEWDWTHLLGTTADIALFVPIGALATRVFGGSSQRSRPIGPSVLLVILFAAVLECGQFFVSSRFTKIDDVLTAAFGGAIGAWWMHRYYSQHLTRETAAAEGRPQTPAYVWMISAGVYAAFLVLVFCQPFEPIQDSSEVGHRWRLLFSTPFSVLESGSFFGAATQLLRKMLWFGPLGSLCLLAARSSSRSPSKRARLFGVLFAAIVALAVGIELFQLVLADHTPDLTDSLLCILGAVCGTAITSFVMRGAKQTSSTPASSVADVHQPNAKRNRSLYRSIRQRWAWPIAIAGFVLLGIWSLLDFRLDFFSAKSPHADAGRQAPSATRVVIYDPRQLANAFFSDAPANANIPPAFSRLVLPDIPGANAIWGATGRDNRGHIWFGVSVTGIDTPSAHLLEYAPASNQVIDRGDVLSELKKAGQIQSATKQSKIHSRIVQGGDGHLYFSSMDEEGEAADGSRLPAWGGHLWRLRLPANEWEHLLAAPEALIAVAGYRDTIYALGYYGHVLYRLDTTSGGIASVRVGSGGGHVSRNMICDSRGHAFVPRLELPTGSDKSPAVWLVEYDASLRELARSPLEHYLNGSPAESHGIVGVQPMADHSILFVTHVGFLYRIIPTDEDLPAVIREEGWFHPAGSAYAPTLFTDDGRTSVVGIAHPNLRAELQYEWLRFDLAERESAAIPVELPGSMRELSGLLLYGSTTRDMLGNFYIAGRCRDTQGNRETPVVIQVRPAR